MFSFLLLKLTWLFYNDFHFSIQLAMFTSCSLLSNTQLAISIILACYKRNFSKAVLLVMENKSTLSDQSEPRIHATYGFIADVTLVFNVMLSHTPHFFYICYLLYSLLCIVSFVFLVQNLRAAYGPVLCLQIKARIGLSMLINSHLQSSVFPNTPLHLATKAAVSKETCVEL